MCIICNYYIFIYREEQQAARDRHKRKVRSCTARAWLLRRPLFGQYENLMMEMMREDRPAFKNFQRVDVELFQELLEKVTPRISKLSTNIKDPLEPGLRLAVTLRYLATGMYDHV